MTEPREGIVEAQRRSPADAGTLAALLRVHGELRLEGRLERLAEEARSLAGAPWAIAVAASEEPGGNPQVLSAGSPAGAAPEAASLAAALAGLDAWNEGERAFGASGPFAAWGPVVAFPVRGAGAEPVAILLLPDAPPLGAAARARAGRLVALAADAVSQGLQVRAIRALVILDDTAECFNRRYFEEFLQEELARATRFRTPMSLIFFDMDNLKQVNNRFGHTMGSRTLWEVSSRVRGRIRKFDKLFRFGGDEFCIVLPETEWHGAVEVAERVREAMAGRNFLVDLAGEGIRVTASFGVASFPLHARTKQELVQRADRAMQQMKASGKNAIAIADLAEETRDR